MSIRKETFQGGGFVLHKVEIPHNYPSKFSAWYDREGNLIDAECLGFFGSSMRPSDKDKDYLKTLGKVWK